MADTITIRLDAEQRRLFDAEAATRGVGPSTLARDLLKERLREIRRAAIRLQSADAAARYKASSDAAESELQEDGLDARVWNEMAPFEGTVGGNRP